MPTEMELTLEQTQQGVSYEVSVWIKQNHKERSKRANTNTSNGRVYKSRKLSTNKDKKSKPWSTYGQHKSKPLEDQSSNPVPHNFHNYTNGELALEELSWTRLARAVDKLYEHISFCLAKASNSILQHGKSCLGKFFVKLNQPVHSSHPRRFEDGGEGPELHGLTSGHISSGLVLNQAASRSAKPPIKNDWDLLFQPMFDEYFKPPSAVSTPISAATLLPTDTARASSSSIDKDVPSPSTSPNIDATNSPINSTNVEPHEEVAEFDSDTFTNQFAPLDTSLAESFSRIVDTSNMHTFQQPSIYIKRWTKDHPFTTIIGDPSKPVSTRCQLSTDALWFYFHAFLAKEELKNYKEAMIESSWIEAMQEEIHEFERLEIEESTLRFETSSSRMVRPALQVPSQPEICQSPRGIFINKYKYALEMLKKYGLDQCDVVDILMVGQSKLDEDPNGTLVDPT
ncbi:hypothetical protein Tco_0034110 [Tanacetum coccineum]